VGVAVGGCCQTRHEPTPLLSLVPPVTSSYPPRLHRRSPSLLLPPTLTPPHPVPPTIQTRDAATTVDTNPLTGGVPIIALHCLPLHRDSLPPPPPSSSPTSLTVNLKSSTSFNLNRVVTRSRFRSTKRA
jgi:hypothetical protein